VYTWALLSDVNWWKSAEFKDGRSYFSFRVTFYLGSEMFVTYIYLGYSVFLLTMNLKFPYILLVLLRTLTFRRRIKSNLPFAGIIRRLPYSTRFQDKG